MYTLVRRYIKTAIGFLAFGLVSGGWLLVRRELGGVFADPYLVSAHTHAILVGFVLLMILGVALWLFPRPEKGDVRYQPRLAEAAYWLLAVGTGVRVVGELARSSRSDAWLRWAIVLAGLMQIAGVGTFFYTMWTRIRGVGSPQREADGERF